MSYPNRYYMLREFSGKVIEIHPKYKAVVQFFDDNKPQRALLWYGKLKVKGEPAPPARLIDDYLVKGTSVRFLCHPFDDSGKDRCQWYITCAWKQELREESLKCCDAVSTGLYNRLGRVSHIARRQGIITHTHRGKEYNVRFLASKLFINGRRVSAKANLMKIPLVEEGRQLYFDAVPSDSDADSNCSWFATIAWRGYKPDMEYDIICNSRIEKPRTVIYDLDALKRIVSSPHTLFLRAKGKISRILNSEFGVAVVPYRKNGWEFVLFHRSRVSLFGLNLANYDLTKIFQIDDKVSVIAAAPPQWYGVRWVASQVRIHIDSSIEELFPLYIV